MYQCWFINSNKWITLMREVNNRRNYIGGREGNTLYFPPNFSIKTKKCSKKYCLLKKIRSKAKFEPCLIWKTASGRYQKDN